MSIKRYIGLGLLCLFGLFLVSAVAVAGQTINFGIGSVLDPSLYPDQYGGWQETPRLLRFENGTTSVSYCVWMEKLQENKMHMAISKSTDNGNSWGPKQIFLDVKYNSYTTVAGTGVQGYNGDNAGTETMLNQPNDIAIDGNHLNYLYIADSLNHMVRRLDTITGQITTVAGSTTSGHMDGDVSQALLKKPVGLAVGNGGEIYIADSEDNTVRMLDANGIMHTVAGGICGNPTCNEGAHGPAAQVTLNDPTAVAYRPNTDYIYICDTGNRVIRRVDTLMGNITTVAGGGISWDDDIDATQASITPVDVFAAGDGLYITDSSSNRVRKFDYYTGKISTVAGYPCGGAYNGDYLLAQSTYFNNIKGVDPTGNMLIADTGNHRIRKLEESGVITTIAGNGSNSTSGSGQHADEAGLMSPVAVIAQVGYSNTQCYVLDSAASRILKIDLGTHNIPGIDVFDAVVDNANTVHVITNNITSSNGGLMHTRIVNGVESHTVISTPSSYDKIVAKMSPDNNTLYVIARSGELEPFSYDIQNDEWSSLEFPVAIDCAPYDFCVDNNRVYVFTGSPITCRVYANDAGMLTDAGSYQMPGPQYFDDYDFASASASPDGKVGLLWVDSNLFYYRKLLFSRFTGDANGFTEPVSVGKEQTITNRDAQIKSPKLFYGGLNDNGEYNIYAMYEGNKYSNSYGCYEIDYLAVSADGGRTFSKDYRASWGDFNGECADFPQTVVWFDNNGGNTVERLIHVWQDDRSNVLRNYPLMHQIYVAQGRLYDKDPEVLVVDDDNSGPQPLAMASYNLDPEISDFGNYESWYIDSLFNIGIPYDYYDAVGEEHIDFYGEHDTPSLDYLKQFKTVVWETGLETNNSPNYSSNMDFGYPVTVNPYNPDNPATISQNEQVLLEDYLNWGGKLFLCSQDFLKDLTDGVDGAVVNNFANNYLSVNGVLNDFSLCGTYDGVAGDPITDGLSVQTTDLISYTKPLTGSTYEFSYFKHILTDGLTLDYTKPGVLAPIFQFEGNNIALRRMTDPYSLVFLAFPFETIHHYEPYEAPTTRETTMSRILNWLDSSQGMYFSKDKNGSTIDTFFSPSDKVYIFAWSNRLNMNSLSEASAVLKSPDNSTYTVTLHKNSSNTADGTFRLTGMPSGDWKVVSLNLTDIDNKTYNLTDRQFNVGLSVKAMCPETQDYASYGNYEARFELRNSAESQATVTARLFDEFGQETTNSSFTVVPADYSSGLYTGIVKIDLDSINTGDYTLALEATDGMTTVTSSAPGKITLQR